MVRLRIAHPDEIAGAADEVAKWGFPRDLEEDDRAGVWVAAEDGARRIGWFWFAWLSREDVALHVCADPANRRPSAAPRAFKAVRWAAELMGARRVWAEQELPGWKRHGQLFYIEVR